MRNYLLLLLLLTSLVIGMAPLRNNHEVVN